MSFTITGIPSIQGIRATTSPSERFWISLLVGGTSKSLRWAEADASGNIYATGSNSSPDMVVQKYNALGTIQWQKANANSGSQTGDGLALDAAGDVYVAGGAATFIGGLMKINGTTGVTTWSRRASGGTFTGTAGVAVDRTNGFVYTIGFTNNPANSIVLWKTNLAGTAQWQRRLAATGLNNANLRVSVNQTTGDVCVLAYQTQLTTGAQDLLILKYNSAGTLQWQRRLGGTATEETGGIGMDAAGNVYVTCYTLSSTIGSYDMFVAKYSSAGTTLEWQRALGGVSADDAYASHTDIAGNTYLVGTSIVSGVNGIQLAKYNASGTLLYQRRMIVTGQSLSGFGVTANNSGSVIITGQNVTTGSGILAKLPADGSLTGTYGGYIYSVSTLTAYTPTLTSATTFFSDVAGVAMISASDVVADSTYTQTLVTVP